MRSYQAASTAQRYDATCSLARLLYQVALFTHDTCNDNAGQHATLNQLWDTINTGSTTGWKTHLVAKQESQRAL
jgi:hypothetical protein